MEMPHRKRKTRKLRGSRTMGYGRVGQHRKSGMRGGYGKAGMHKHKWSYTIKYEPEHFGKHGFKSIRGELKAINVEELEELVRKGRYSLNESNIPVIDLNKEGFDKLIGRGRINTKVKVIVRKASRKAISKVESVGGKVIIAS